MDNRPYVAKSIAPAAPASVELASGNATGTSGARSIPRRLANTRESNTAIEGQRGCVVWFTGISASGKSTIARRVDTLLLYEGYRTCVLDGDDLRKILKRGSGIL